MAPNIAAAVDRMSPAERRTLAREIIETLTDVAAPLTDAQRVELGRRLDDFDVELEHSVPWEAVKAELQTKHGW